MKYDQNTKTARDMIKFLGLLKAIQFVFCCVILLLLGGCGQESTYADPIWDECSAYLVKNGVDLSADDYTWYADMCKVVRRYTHDKLTPTEIMVAMDKMTDLIQEGTVVEYKVFMVSTKDRVRASVRLLEMMPETKGKLKYEEKEALVACALWVCTISGSDMDVRKAFAVFKDFDEFEGQYKKMKEHDYSPMFIRHDSGSEGRFGYDITNPIRTISIADSYRYINRLRPMQDSIKFDMERIGSMSGYNKNIVDAWKFSCEDSIAQTNYTFTIYIDPYSEESSDEAFAGWRLLKE
jgi:hypothetical protein